MNKKLFILQYTIEKIVAWKIQKINRIIKIY